MIQIRMPFHRISAGFGFIVVVAAFLRMASQAHAGDWKPASGPLMTKWSQDVDPESVLPEYPRPQMVRSRWMNLNGLWDYAVVAKDADRPAAFDGQILVPFPIESALSGVMRRLDEQSRLWYRRTFEIPSSWSGQRVLLHFGAVDWETTVFVNGHEAGTHRGGYDPFHMDITESLTDSGPQELVVAVWDPTQGGQPRGKQVRKPGGIMYTPTSGIWQTVWLEPVADWHIEQLVITPDLDKSAVEIKAPSTTPGDGELQCNVSILDGDQKVHGGVITVNATNQDSIECSVKLGRPDWKLWSPDSPFLYDLQVELLRDGQRVDRVFGYFGMRKVEVGKDDRGITRILLNNESIFQVGFLDQGFWPDGLYTAPTDEALRFDIEMTKKLGMNMARKHVKVEPARWYFWCDKLGLLVWQDMPSGDNRTDEDQQQFEQELGRLVEAHYSHPSIIMWVVFNEGWGQHDTQRLCRRVKEMDPMRLVSNASGWTDKKVGDIVDMHQYPGPGSPEPEALRAAVLGEFGGLGLAVDGHTWSRRSWGYRGMSSRDSLTRRYVKLLRQVYALKDDPGLSAAVYTQTTDVETECNGLMTYDRAVVKPDLDQVAEANRGRFPPAPKIDVVLASSEQQAATWHYTFDEPAEDWFRPDYDAQKWKEGQAGFGTQGTPGSVVRTEWNTSDIWLRREFSLDHVDPEGLYLWIHHDEDAVVYLNGIRAARVRGYTTGYEEIDVAPDAAQALKPGRNVMAIHCHQTGGGQYIDAGLVAITPAEPSHRVEPIRDSFGRRATQGGTERRAHPRP